MGEVVVVIVLGVAVVVEGVGPGDVDALVTGEPGDEQAPSSPSTPNAATTASPRYPCMDDGNPTAWPPTER